MGAQVDAQHLTERAYRQPARPAVGRELAGQHELAGTSVGIDPGEAAVLEGRVRRWANRHGCQAPARLAVAVAAADGDGPDAMTAAVDAEKIRADPAAYCQDPRHAEDAVWLAETLELLGLRETVRRGKRSRALSPRPSYGKGWCASCGYKQPLRMDGTVMGHDVDGARCPGSAEKPEEVAE